MKIHDFYGQIFVSTLHTIRITFDTRVKSNSVEQISELKLFIHLKTDCYHGYVLYVNDDTIVFHWI